MSNPIFNIPPAKVYWVTGLAGSGKSTLAKLLWQSLREIGQPCVLLDGDILREVLGTFGYDQASRLEGAQKNAHLCRMLSNQGIPVVCATISLFHEIHVWNREHIPGYIEIFLEVPMDVLIQRDQKGLYSAALKGQQSNVVGIDIQPEWPLKPDITLNNDGSKAIQVILNQLLDQLE